MRETIKWALILLVTSLNINSQVVVSTGGVRGVVVDQNGKPVAAATVFLAGALRSPRTATDAQGRFLLKGFSGDWGILAFKESDGYPNNFPAFFQNPGEQFPYVHVDLGAIEENIVIRLGSKAGTLKFDISDEQGQPVNATLSFSRPDMPEIGEYRKGISAKGSLLVPAVPLRLTVETDGFEPWHYGGEEWRTDKGLILPLSGQTQTISVRLQELHAHSDTARN